MKRLSFYFGIGLACRALWLAQQREMILPVSQSAYSQAVKIKGGTLVFLSGVGPADEKGVLRCPWGLSRTGASDVGEHAPRSCESPGGSVDDIVTMTGRHDRKTLG